MSSFGSRVKDIRKKLNLSQEMLAEKLDLTRASIAAIEADKNKCSQDTLCRLLLTFNININYLLSGIGTPFIQPQFEDAKEEILKEVDDILIKYGVKNK